MNALFIVIPAYHGAATIGRCLGSLAAQRLPPARLHARDVHIVVAVNDGRSDTLAAAKAGLRALEDTGFHTRAITTGRGRTAAFSAAERFAPADAHRVYLDQDAALSPGALDALARALDAPGSVFATLQPACEPSPSRCVRAYYRAWLHLPYVKRSPVTMGMFAVSARGRARWQAWPALDADDKFARLRFAPSERRLIAEESYAVLPPSSLGELLAARARYRRSNRQLLAHGHRDAVARHAGLLRLAADPRHWSGLMVIAAVELAARLKRAR